MPIDACLASVLTVDGHGLRPFSNVILIRTLSCFLHVQTVQRRYSENRCDAQRLEIAPASWNFNGDCNAFRKIFKRSSRLHNTTHISSLSCTFCPSEPHLMILVPFASKQPEPRESHAAYRIKDASCAKWLRIGPGSVLCRSCRAARSPLAYRGEVINKGMFVHRNL